MNVNEAAKRAGVSPVTIRAAIYRGALKATRYWEPRGPWEITEEALRRALTDGKVSNQVGRPPVPDPVRARPSTRKEEP